ADVANVGAGNLDNLPGPVVFDGGVGADSIIVNDATAGFSDAYTLTSTTLSRIFFGGVTHFTPQAFPLQSENRINTININSTNGPTAYVINGDDGGDTINVGAGNLDALPGPVTVNGGNGTDAIVVNDQAPFGDGYTITSTTLTRVIFGGLTYGTAE